MINSGQSTGMGLHGTLRERCFGHGCVIVQQFTALTRKRTRGLPQVTTEPVRRFFGRLLPAPASTCSSPSSPGLPARTNVGGVGSGTNVAPN